MKKRHSHNWLRLLLIVVLLMILWAGQSLWRSTYSLTCTSFTLETEKVTAPVRIVQLTDLHDSLFGEKNQRLLKLVAEQSPDLILVTGDLLNSDDPRTDIALDLIAGLGDIAPVYVSPGNHEMEYQENYGTDILALYEAIGAVVLDREYVDIDVRGQQIRLGGIYGYCVPAKYLATNEASPEECAFLSDFQDTDRYTVLMCHMPVCWILNDGLDEWDVDCVFSGHVHGGQVVLPFLGGVYGPDMGWFPGKMQGLFTSSDGNKCMILSSGLGNTESVPRFNNIPEIVCAVFL